MCPVISLPLSWTWAFWPRSEPLITSVQGRIAMLPLDFHSVRMCQVLTQKLPYSNSLQWTEARVKKSPYGRAFLCNSPLLLEAQYILTVLWLSFQCVPAGQQAWTSSDKDWTAQRTLVAPFLLTLMKIKYSDHKVLSTVSKCVTEPGNVVTIYTKMVNSYKWDFSINKSHFLKIQQPSSLPKKPNSSRPPLPLQNQSILFITTICFFLQLNNEFKVSREENFISKHLKD